MTGVTFSEEQVKSLLKMGVAQKHDPGSTTLTGTSVGGPYDGNYNQLGIFTDATARPQRFSALARMRMGLARAMPAPIRSLIFEERLEVMTGVTAMSGSNPSGWCGTPPTIGVGKVCRQDFNWGRNFWKTELHAVPEMGNIATRGIVPAEILNSGSQANPLIPDIMFRLADPMSTLQYSLWRSGIAEERSLEKVIWQGNSSLSEANTQLGWFDEFDGIDRQIKTGYTDAGSNVLCPAMDSIVVSWNADIGATVSGDNFVQALSSIVWAAKYRALIMEFGDEVTFGLAMRPEQFRRAVENWACNYETYRCTTGSAGAPVVNLAKETNDLRREMIRGQYLLVDDEPIPVIFSEGILRERLSNTLFKSDIYLLPLAWQGTPLLHLDYFPMDNPYITEWRNFGDGGDERTVLNNGMYLASKARTPMCDELHFASKMRLILETPFLAGRLDDVQYTFTEQIRNADPADTAFYANGGKTYQGWPA